VLSCACAQEVCPQGPPAPPAPAGRRPRFEVADVFRLWGERYRTEHPLWPDQLKVMSLIQRCRTAALGSHLDRCDACGYELPSYNSCRNRHCPKCQTLAKDVSCRNARKISCPSDTSISSSPCPTR